MNTIPDEILEADEAWIEAIPEDNYDKCPCNCGMKWKFAKENIAEHEQTFYKNFLAKQKVIC